MCTGYSPTLCLLMYASLCSLYSDTNSICVGCLLSSDISILFCECSYVWVCPCVRSLTALSSIAQWLSGVMARWLKDLVITESCHTISILFDSSWLILFLFPGPAISQFVPSVMPLAIQGVSDESLVMRRSRRVRWRGRIRMRLRRERDIG